MPCKKQEWEVLFLSQFVSFSMDTAFPFPFSSSQIRERSDGREGRFPRHSNRKTGEEEASKKHAAA